MAKAPGPRAQAGRGDKQRTNPSAAPRRLEEAVRLLEGRQSMIADLAAQREEVKVRDEQLQRTEEALWVARRRLSDLYELAPIPYLTLTRVGVIAGINRKGAELLARDPSRIIGKPLAQFVALGDRRLMRQHIAVCHRRRETVKVELELALPDGPGAVELWSCLSGEGTIYTAIADLRDRRREEAERRALAIKAEAARAASEAKDQFLATLSHELRTPLAPLVMAFSALERLCRERDVPAEHLLSNIRRNIGQEVHLIDDLLDITRLTHRKLVLDKRPVDLRAVVREAAEQLLADAQDKGVRLAIELGASRHLVSGDPDRLRQVFANLLHNAIKFTPPKGRVTVRSRADRGSLVIEVQDTGMGIRAEDRVRIFDRFTQGASPRPREGLGLGLSIAHEIVRAHGGHIEAKSDGPDCGATFELRLPPLAASEREAADAPWPRPQPTEAPIAAVSGGRILLVEDHRDTAQVTAELLEKAGYQVLLADSVAAALAIAGAHRRRQIGQDAGRDAGGDAGQRFDVLVSDIGLPDGSGLDLMRQLRARGLIAGIALSGYGTRGDVARSRAAGFQRHLVKPIDLPDLLRAIQEARSAVVASNGAPRRIRSDSALARGRRRARWSPVAGGVGSS